MECAVIEFARNVCGLKADSSEFDPATPHRVFYMLRELRGADIWAERCGWERGRVSWSPALLALGLWELEISERHRHRYEFNREYEEIISSYGMEFSGNTPDGNYVRRSSRCRTIRGSWDASSIRNSNRSRSFRIPCLRVSSRLPIVKG